MKKLKDGSKSASRRGSIQAAGTFNFQRQRNNYVFLNQPTRVGVDEDKIIQCRVRLSKFYWTQAVFFYDYAL